MGQKINPISFRLGIRHKWDSQWHSQSNYSDLIHEDNQIRNYLKSIFTKAGLFSEHPLIERSYNQVKITVNLCLRNEQQKENTKIFDLINMKKIIATLEKITNSPVSMVVREVNVYEHASLLADFIALKFEQRNPFSSTLKKAMKNVMTLSNTKGVKIQCSGRLNGEDMARTEWVKEGEVPLQSLNAFINYGYARAYTMYGVCGIKVWISKKL